jgi:hypothetical protein
VREQRVVTPDGHVWHVRRRWAKRRLPWKRRAVEELGPSERDAGAVLPDAHELTDSVGDLINYDGEFGLLMVLALLGLTVLGIGALFGAARAWVLPLLLDNARPVAAVLAAAAALLLLDRLTRPWFIEAESARLLQAPRRIWRTQGWWRTRRAFRAVAAAIADGRIDPEHGVILFPGRSQAP